MSCAASFRRVALAVALTGAWACSGGSPTGGSPPSQNTAVPADVPVTGTAVPGMEAFDTGIPALMRQYGIPGGAVAVVRDGRLVYARGFGHADVEAKETVQPDALFRIASVSKPITAVAVLHLVERRQLELTALAFALLSQLKPNAGGAQDARIAQIRVLDLLEHAGGWDRDSTRYDPMFDPKNIAAAMGTTPPADAETIVRYMLGRPLDFDPGSRHVYSNFGYAVLGRIIEHASAQKYADYVAGSILAPMGIQRMRQGRSLLAQRAPGEVKYYAPGATTVNTPLVESVFPGQGAVPAAYGGFYLEAMDAHGAWIASTVDLLRFLTAVDGLPSRPDFLSVGSIVEMTRRPPVPDWQSSNYWYGMGWLVRPVPASPTTSSGADANWWHDGSLPGTTTLLVRAYNGIAWAALFNARTDNGAFASALDSGLWDAVGKVTAWPAHDLFPQFP